MNSKHHRLIGALILLFGLVASHTVLAAEIVITKANPNEADQGTLDQPVKITGTGFDKTVKEVKFLVHCESTPEVPCVDDPGGITVRSFKVNHSKEITAYIDISETADLASFDIAMTTRGRGGKGTTFKSEEPLFTVKKLPSNLVEVPCDDIIENPLGSCTCRFSWDGNENIYGLLDHCVTSETLKLKSMIRTAGSVQANGTERLSITAVPCDPNNGPPDNRQDCTEVGSENFSGSSVIENWFHRARVRYLDIVIGAGVSDGCNGGDFQSAISFVLRPDTLDPKTTLPVGNGDPINRNSLFFVSDIGIYTEADEPLCNGIEVIRTPEYTAKYSNTDPNVEKFPARDWKIQVTNNEISAGSYVEAGIVMLGVMPSESINPPIIFGNTIFDPACEDPNGADYVAKAIHFGMLTPDPIKQIEGVVEGNTIIMAPDCGAREESYTAGVLVVGDTPVTQTMVKVNKNDIYGAFIGVEVDSNVVEVNFSGNTLTGVGGVGTGILSDARCTRTKGKPNKIKGYNNNDEPDDTGCP